jgi:predicted deacylase
MSALGMIDRPPQPSRVQYVVEDARPSSGHMQICNPAPHDGFFEPAVAVGEPIESGQPLGMLCDVLGEDSQAVRAQESGLIAVLRTCCRVQAGDSLAVIVPV